MLVLEKSARRSDPPHGQESTFDNEQNSLRGDSVSSDEPHDYEAVIGDLIKNASAADTPERLSQILQDGRRKTKRFIEAAEATLAELIHILRPAISAHGQEGEDILNRTFAPQAPDSTHQRPVLPYGFRYREKDGAIEFRKSIKAKKDGGGASDKSTVDVDEEWVWLCSPLEIVAHSRNIDGVRWGLLVRVQDPDGVWHEVIVGRDAITGQDEFLRELCTHGLIVSSARGAKPQMRKLLTLAGPNRRARVTHRTGWHGETLFMIGGEAIGDQGEEYLIYDGPSDAGDPYKLGGDFEVWRDGIASLGEGNSRLAFSISAAFAGPLLHLLGIEGGGFHWRSRSSDGKTVLLRAAGSVWGKCPGQHKGFLRSWRGTANGLEATALQHNHTLLLLDEIGEVDAKEAGQIAYMLSNGNEKLRGHRQGGARRSESWQLMFLSSGEVSLAQKMAEAGGGTKAGQDVRLADLPADAGKGFGVFEELHGFGSSKDLAEHLERMSNQHYGHAGRLFIHEVARDPEAAAGVVNKAIDVFARKHTPEGASRQVGRVARRFALVGAAGELATRRGILPWRCNAALGAAERMFKAWIEARGGVGAGENISALSFIRRLLEKDGNTRFALWGAATGQSTDLLGVRGSPKSEHDGRFFIAPAVLGAECSRAKIDIAHVLTALSDAGAIKRDEKRKSWTQFQRVPHFEHCRSWYVIDAEKVSSIGAATE